MASLHDQQPKDRTDYSFDPPDSGNSNSGGKTAGSAAAGEYSFDPPDSGNSNSGGKTAGSAAAGEH
ncbi:MAG TPA: hypothetical protein DD490_02485 [Acidobacteria bacterium]|nr:hypothetical protein [Acidobacteriota bacterium]